jgi:hypothetical protein
VIIHAGDMPQHGRRFHSGFPDTYEDFNDRDPRELRIEDLLGSIKSKKINYFFGKITEHTDKMIEVTFFETVYGRNKFCILIVQVFATVNRFPLNIFYSLTLLACMAGSLKPWIP